jgi:Protein of unknown function (DUF3168)
MTNAVRILQSAVINALEAHPALADALTGVYDGPPPHAAFPYVAIADGVVNDWSTKTATGREVRLALTIWDDGQEATRLHDLIGHVEDAFAALPCDLPGWRIASCIFLRSLVARDAAGPWAGLVEYRVRMMAATYAGTVPNGTVLAKALGTVPKGTVPEHQAIG